MYMAMERVLELAAGPIHVREDGPTDAPPVVLVHGLLVAGSIWDPVTDRLAVDHHVFVPELPLGAHRTAMRPDADLTPPGLAAILADVLDALGLDDVTLVANDTGGAIAQVLVTTRPERVGRVVLVSCDAFDNFPPQAFKPLVAAGARVPGTLTAVRLALGVRAFRRTPLAFGWLAKHGLPDALVDAWAAPLRDPAIRRDTRKVLAGVDKRHTLEAARRLPAFTKPALLAWAAEDRFFPIALAHRLAALLPDGRVEPIADSYTFVQRDQPDRLAGLVRAFAAERTVAA